MTRLEQIKARTRKLWRWDSPSQGVDYTDDSDGVADEAEIKAFEDGRYGNGKVTRYDALLPDDLAALLAVVKAAERLVDAKGRELAPEFVNLTALIRTFREGGGEG